MPDTFGGPDVAVAVRERADMLLQAGDFEHAIPLLRDLIAASGADAALERKLAGALDATGAAEEALAGYRRALALDPADARAHDELGRLLGRRGDIQSAAEHLRAAVKLDPSLVMARGALGDLLCREGRHGEAVAELKAALAQDPGSWPLALRLGTALTSLGAERQGEAADCFRRVIALSPGNAVAHLQLGLAFWRRGDAAPAIALAERAARLDPKLGAAHGALGSMLRAAGRNAEAVASLRAALALNPDDAAACFHLGMCLSDGEGKDQREGLDYLRRAIALAPRNLLAHRKLAWTLSEADRREEARTAYRAALEIFPDDPVLRVGATMATLPIVAQDVAEVERCRAEYAASLASLEEFFARRRAGGISPAQAREDAEAVGTAQPFFLAYQGRDDRELQARHGRVVTGIMSAAYPQWASAPAVPPPRPGEPIRVAIVSGHLRGHSVLKIPVWGWTSLIDRRRFSLFGYHTAGHPDGETARVRRAFARFVQGPLPVERWCETIRADAPHVVIFPEIGMDQMTARLAGLRLAPVQASSWGHPETSGFPTIDYFLSSDLMEPPEADAYYTEKLVRLPNLGIAYDLKLASATVAITGGFSGDGDVLSANVSGTSITASYNAATEVLTLTGSDTLAHYQSVLDSVTFNSTSSNPTNFGNNRTRTVSWTLNDGSGSNNLSTPATTTISFQGVPPFDFNGDVISDLVFQNEAFNAGPNTGTPQIWLWNGTAVTSRRLSPIRARPGTSSPAAT